MKTDWFYPHGGVPDFVLPWSLGTFFASFLLKYFVDEKRLIIALLVSLGVVLAVFARIKYDVTYYDPTSHNLWPLEIIICGIITIPSAYAGTFLGLLLRILKKLK